MKVYQAGTVYTCCRARGRALGTGSPPASGPTLTPFLTERNMAFIKQAAV